MSTQPDRVRYEGIDPPTRRKIANDWSQSFDGATAAERELLREAFDDVVLSNGNRESKAHPKTDCGHPLCAGTNREWAGHKTKSLAVFPPGYLEWCRKCLAIFRVAYTGGLDPIENVDAVDLDAPVDVAYDDVLPRGEK